MDDREATESALVVAARSDSLQVRELIPKIDDGVRALRVELKSEIGDVRNDLDEFRAEFSGFRAEVNDRFAEVNDRFAEVNTRIDTGLSGLRTEIKAELSEHREMLQRITAHLGI